MSVVSRKKRLLKLLEANNWAYEGSLCIKCENEDSDDNILTNRKGVGFCLQLET